MIFPVVAYAPTAATKPSIAAQPLNLSASGVIRLYLFCIVNCVLIFILENAWNYPSSKSVVDYGCKQTHHGKSTIHLLCGLPVVH